VFDFRIFYLLLVAGWLAVVLASANLPNNSDVAAATAGGQQLCDEHELWTWCRVPSCSYPTAVPQHTDILPSRNRTAKAPLEMMSIIARVVPCEENKTIKQRGAVGGVVACRSRCGQPMSKVSQ